MQVKAAVILNIFNCELKWFDVCVMGDIITQHLQ